jgi:hypothetical protein
MQAKKGELLGKRQEEIALMKPASHSSGEKWRMGVVVVKLQ